MILAFDTYYFGNKAKTVCIAFKNWADAAPLKIFEETIEGIAEYEPGSFYKRELPCILSLLKQIDLNEVDFILVDGFVLLDDNGKFGLGGHLFEALDRKVSIIGVAKSGFHSNKQNTKELLRGKSKKPLFISALGIELDQAFEKVNSMHGSFRMPTLLQILDTQTKENLN
ncbi:endonuclease V [Flexithrix dorotheae]|uniref:endonuclease V n=1 Tax=Flexithrix dorotheae TaxID=70993 RepID=UPI000364E93B|nr:endonuclease V [Flexithrix dorotheae]